MFILFRKTLTIAIIFMVSPVAMTSSVSATAEFATYADILARTGIIHTQDSDSGYRLGDRVTRAEVAKIAVRLAGSGANDCKGNVYSDVTADLGDLCGYVEAAADAGIVSRSYDRFRFSDSVTRAELVKMLLATMGVNPSEVSAGFSDVSVSQGDLVGYINAGVAGGCIKASALFRPNAPSTRGEVFKMAVCTMKYKQSPLAAYGWKIVWSDEFSGDLLDTAKWNLETGADGWGNNELQNYTESGNVFVSSGNLVIEARKEQSDGASYSSARINTHEKASWTYGRIEARIKLPSGQGIWPAFWMLGENIDTVGYPASGEMDIVEMIGGKSADDGADNERTIYGTIHRPNHDPNPEEAVKSIGSISTNPTGANWGDDFHIYGIEWDSKTVKHYVDGQIYGITDISSGIDGFDVFHQPFYIILNLAVGVNWPGSPDATTIFPQRMLVDWVRVYQK